MSGPVERAIRDHVAAGDHLPTPTGRATFIVHELSASELVLLLGKEQTRTRLSWECLEGIPAFLRGRESVPVGANRDLPGNSTTVDGYLKDCINRQTANYVAVALERAILVELDRSRPARVRLR